MFWKAVILAAFGIFASWWGLIKERERAKGIRLRKNRKGVYVPFEPMEIAERWAKRAVVALYIFTALFGLWFVWPYLNKG